MNSAHEMTHPLGAFEPFEAKRVIAMLERRQIPFDVEADYSALANPSRWLQLYFGIYPDGAKIVLHVPESELARAEDALREMLTV